MKQSGYLYSSKETGTGCPVMEGHLPASKEVWVDNNISSATVIVRAEGDIWLNPFTTVLFNVCISVTRKCCVLYPCCVGVFVRFAIM